MIEDRHVKLGDLLELLCAQIRKSVVAAHAQVGAVQLKHEAGAMDGVVFYGRSRRNGSTRSRKKRAGDGGVWTYEAKLWRIS
jgi:hypothetical protein